MKVTCYASGVIGASWATAFALNKYDVWVYDLKEELLEQAKIQIEKNLKTLYENDCLGEANSKSVMDKIHFTTSPEDALKESYFVQESGPENLEIKKSIVKIIDELAPHNCVVASSTSGLQISKIASESKYPERYVGAHPFNPPHLIPLVEITKGDKTSDKYVESAVEFYRKNKKEPIVLKKEKIGFVANRLSHAVLREVMSLVDEGVFKEYHEKYLSHGYRWLNIKIRLDT